MGAATFWLGMAAARATRAMIPREHGEVSGVRVVSLASGSSGNALLIDAGHTRLLIDAGLSGLRLERELASLGVAAASLDAVLITHEHVDHVAGLPVLARRNRLPVYLTRGTARAVPGIGRLDPQAIAADERFRVGELTVTAMPLCHDAAEPVGYLIEAGTATIAVLTDLGCAEPHLVAPLARADLIVLEANHDLDLLWNGRYAWPLKRRVAGARGHLCNDDCGGLLASAIAPTGRPRTVWLAHLSQENNRPELARAAVVAQLGARPAAVAVLPRQSHGPIWQAPEAEPLAGD